jgi:hypothetical protein
VSQKWIGIDQTNQTLTPEDYRRESRRVAQGDQHANGRMPMNCPHCKSPAIIRTSRRVSVLVREIYYQCTNVVCGHTFKATIEIIKTISPSAMPDPAIAAQLSPHPRPLMTQASPTETPASTQRFLARHNQNAA